MILDVSRRELEMIREMGETADAVAARHGPLFERLMTRVGDLLAQDQWRQAGYPQMDVKPPAKTPQRRVTQGPRGPRRSRTP